MGSRNDGAFSRRETVGCKHRSVPLSGNRPQGELEGCVAAQPVEIVGVLIAAGDRENPGAQNLGQAMGDAAGIAFVRDHHHQPFGKVEPPLRLQQQHDPAIRAEASAVKRGGDLFALYRWKPEQQQIIVGDRAGVARSNLL